MKKAIIRQTRCEKSGKNRNRKIKTGIADLRNEEPADEAKR